MTGETRRVVQIAMGSWTLTLRLCVIIIVVVAATIVVPAYLTPGTAPYLFMR